MRLTPFARVPFTLGHSRWIDDAGWAMPDGLVSTTRIQSGERGFNAILRLATLSGRRKFISAVPDEAGDRHGRRLRTQYPGTKADRDKAMCAS